MKNIFVRVLVNTELLFRQFACPTKVLLSLVPIAPNSVQILLRKNYKDAMDILSWRRAHALFGLTCLVAIVSFVLFDYALIML